MSLTGPNHLTHETTKHVESRQRVWGVDIGAPWKHVRQTRDLILDDKTKPLRVSGLTTEIPLSS